MASAAHSDSPVAGTGLSADGETNIVPDLSTLRQIPWRESHYIANVDMRYASGKGHVLSLACRFGAPMHEERADHGLHLSDRLSCCRAAVGVLPAQRIAPHTSSTAVRVWHHHAGEQH